MENVTIVMYHYVRELIHARYPNIKGLHLDDFKEQILYIKKYYNPISAYELMDAIQYGAALPEAPVLLTFDDAFAEHFTTVFPILDQENIPGCFFPPARCILENKVLAVHKIHFILACVKDTDSLMRQIQEFIDAYKTTYALQTNEYYWQQCGIASRMDTAQVMYIKTMLQNKLPEALRNKITDHLFTQFVTDNEAAFARELYMNLDQIRCLQRNNMYIGSHGFEHNWLDSISAEAQKKEIDLSLRFLETVGSRTERWIMCYPYGVYNTELLSLLKNTGCVAGLTTQVGIAQGDNPLTLPRLDTNDLPKKSSASPNEWTQMALAASSIMAC